MIRVFYLKFLACLLVLLFYYLFIIKPVLYQLKYKIKINNQDKTEQTKVQDLFDYNYDVDVSKSIENDFGHMEFIFIGGYARSGTTLMRYSFFK